MSGGSHTPEGRAELAARLVAAGFVVPRAEAVVIDLANDPPLSRSQAVTAMEEAARVVAGLGAAMLAAGAKRGRIAVRERDAEATLRAVLELLGTRNVAVVRMEERWPSLGIDRDLDCRYAWVLDGNRLLDLEAVALRRAPAMRRITIAGEVARPGVYAFKAPPSVEELVARAGGSTAPADAWLALDGGAYGGALADREAPVHTALVLVLGALHPLIARARLGLADQLRRAASACEGCRVCTDVCPVFLDGTALEPHVIIARLTANRDPGTESAAATACIGCELCSAACPGGLAPAVLVQAVKHSLLQSDTPLPSLARAEPHPDRALRRTSIDLLMMRAGLAPAPESA